jgi:hypothetical protein
MVLFVVMAKQIPKNANPKQEVAAGAPMGSKSKNKPGPWDDIARGVTSVVKTADKTLTKASDVVYDLTGAKALEKAIKNPSPKSVAKAVIDVGSSAVAGSAKGLSKVAGSSIASRYGSRIGSGVEAFSARGVTATTKGAPGLLKIAANDGSRAARSTARVIRSDATAVSRAGILGGVAAAKKSTAPKNKSKNNKR